MKRKLLILSVLLAAVAITTAVAQHGGRPLFATLTGAAEVPGPGDPDGSGIALIRLNQGQEEICYDIAVSGITLPATGAHIHVGDATEFGPVVVGLTPPDATGTSSGCVAAPAELIKAIRKNPEEYYVNVHTLPLYGAGAVRGQLTLPGAGD